MSNSEFTTFAITEGQLVRYYHDRPDDACEVSDRTACLALLGFTDYHTGGGCMALRVERGDAGEYLLVTDYDSSIPTSDGPLVVVGSYDNDGQNTEDFGGEECETFPTASNEVLYERVICWLGLQSRTMRGQS
jgi:hypothetical protein